MSGVVYPKAMEKQGLECLTPTGPMRERLNAAIFDQLCQGTFDPATTKLFLQAIDDLKSKGAQCVILGCTEIPLIVTSANSSLPTLDSTRLPARYAVREAVSARPITIKAGWLEILP